MGFFDSFIKQAKEMEDKYAETVSIKCDSCGAKLAGKINKKAFLCEFCGNYTNNPEYENYIAMARSNSNNNANFNTFNTDSSFSSASHYGHTYGSYCTYAWIEKSGLFYSGEIPGISFSKVSLCHSYEECLDKLKQKYYKEISSSFFKPPVQNMEEIRMKYPKAIIVELD